MRRYNELKFLLRERLWTNPWFEAVFGVFIAACVIAAIMLLMMIFLST